MSCLYDRHSAVRYSPGFASTRTGMTYCCIWVKTKQNDRLSNVYIEINVYQPRPPSLRRPLALSFAPSRPPLPSPQQTTHDHEHEHEHEKKKKTTQWDRPQVVGGIPVAGAGSPSGQPGGKAPPPNAGGVPADSSKAEAEKGPLPPGLLLL